MRAAAADPRCWALITAAWPYHCPEQPWPTLSNSDTVIISIIRWPSLFKPLLMWKVLHKAVEREREGGGGGGYFSSHTISAGCWETKYYNWLTRHQSTIHGNYFRASKKNSRERVLDCSNLEFIKDFCKFFVVSICSHPGEAGEAVSEAAATQLQASVECGYTPQPSNHPPPPHPPPTTPPPTQTAD